MFIIGVLVLFIIGSLGDLDFIYMAPDITWRYRIKTNSLMPDS